MSGVDDKQNRIREAVRGLLAAEEAFVIRANEGGEIQVSELGDWDAKASGLRVTHPQLAGQLMVASGSIGTGCSLLPIFIGLWLVIVTVAEGGWLSGIAADLLNHVEHGWGKVVLAVVLLSIYGLVDDAVEAGRYRRVRPTVIDAAAKAGIDVHALLAALEGDTAFDSLTRYMKKDSTLAHAQAWR